MSSLTDFNDLHLAQGLAAVRDQIMAAINPQPASPKPAATSQPEIPAPLVEQAPRFSLESLLEKFALIHGETKIWDMANRKAIKKTAFMDLVGKKLGREWMEHPNRRTIKNDAIKALSPKKGSGEQEEILERYVYLYPTKTAWDSQRKEIVQLDALKVAIPADYEWWLKNPQRKKIDIENLVFDPKQRADPDTHINMFTGLPLRPDKNTDGCKNIMLLVWNLCNDDPDVFAWLCKWLAYPLQKVGAKLDTSILMHSDIQGTGKSMLFSDLMPQIYGKYAVVVGQHQLESQYTEWRSNVLFGAFEEIFSRNQKYSHMGTVKHMITGKTQRIEKKFVSGWEESNHMNAAFLSNELQPFPIEPSDRRMFVIWPKQTMPIELQYAAGAEIDNGKGAEAFYHFLLNYPLDDFNSHTKPPETEAKRRLIDYGLPPWDIFLADWQAGDLAVPYCSCTSNDLYIAYSKFCRRRNEHLISQTKFATIMSTKLTKRKVRFTIGTQRCQGAAFVIVPKDEKRKEVEWLSAAIELFNKRLENMEG